MSEIKGQEYKWYVWRVAGGHPMKVHHTLQSAMEEAKRLAVKQRDEVLVLEVIGSYRPSTPPVEWVPTDHEALF